MRINILNNERHSVVAEMVRDLCVVTSDAAATRWHADVVYMQLLAIGQRN